MSHNNSKSPKVLLHIQDVTEDPLIAPCSIVEPATKLVLRKGLLSNKCPAQLGRIAKTTEHSKRNFWYIFFYFLFLCAILENGGGSGYDLVWLRYPNHNQ